MGVPPRKLGVGGGTGGARAAGTCGGIPALEPCPAGSHCLAAGEGGRAPQPFHSHPTLHSQRQDPTEGPGLSQHSDHPGLSHPEGEASVSRRALCSQVNPSLHQHPVLKLRGRLALVHSQLFSNQHLLNPNPLRGSLVPYSSLCHMV